MSTTYFLTFLLALVALFAATTARHNDGDRLDQPREIPSANRFHSKNWGKTKNYQHKSIEKSPDDVATQRAKLKPARARRTMERELEKTVDQDLAVDSMSAAGTMNKNLESINGRAMPEAQPEYFVSGFNKKTAKEKLEEGTARKPVGYRGEAIDTPKYDENMHQ